MFITKKQKLLLLVSLSSACISCSSAIDKHAVSSIDNSEYSYIKTELLFGMSMSNGDTISEVEWNNFVTIYISPRFNEGFTLVDALGQWIMTSMEVIQEKSKIVIILHQDTEAANNNIEFIREKYKKLYNQESVLRITSAVTVSF